MPLFGRRDSWPHCSARPDEAILTDFPQESQLQVLQFKMTALPTETSTLEAANRFARGKDSITVRLGVFPTAELAKSAQRNMELAILRSPMFMRRGRDLRGLGQVRWKADEDVGTEGIYLMRSAHCHFMRLANVAVSTIGLGLSDAVSVPAWVKGLHDYDFALPDPVGLMGRTVEAQLDRLATLTGRN